MAFGTDLMSLAACQRRRMETPVAGFFGCDVVFVGCCVRLDSSCKNYRFVGDVPSEMLTFARPWIPL